VICIRNENNELLKLLNGIKFIEKTYDSMRIVDPIKNKILSYRENKIIESDSICHQFWNKKNNCENCISLRAYQENEVFIKLEYLKDKVYMVLAVPIIIGDIKVVLELLKDVSKNMVVVKADDGGIEVDVHSILANADNLLFKDSLTGIFNRRFIDERLQVDILKNAIHKETLSLIMADIDHFKVVNDTYGHLAGDYILKEIAIMLGSCIRAGKDWVARYGGEEFLICLPKAQQHRSIEIAERMRKKIEDSIFEFEGKEIRITTSFGVHSLVYDDGSSLESLISFADKNLYKAKESGRNKVVST